MRVCSPAPGGNLHSRASFLSLGLSQRPRVAFSFGFALLCLILSITTASAQTGARRTGVKSEERLRRVIEDQEGANELGQQDEVEPAPQNPQVRKTALTYSPRAGNEGAERPALTNDIVIISRAPEARPARKLVAPKSGVAPSNVPSMWPVSGMLRTGYGMRNDPFGGPSVEFHKGQDISAPTGTPVNATADGVVVIAGWVKGYGNGIYIDHGNGVSTRYGHLSRIDVAVGQAVRRGEHLGLVGSTGRSTGPHLHYEVRINGQAINPTPYLPVVAPPPVVLPQPTK